MQKKAKYSMNLSGKPVLWINTSKAYSLKDCYSGGMLIPERNFSGGIYRYSINGQEKEDEISGSGNHTTAIFWEYDPRLVRRWNVDPVVKPYESSYACFGNNPISTIDPLGNDSALAGDSKTWNWKIESGDNLSIISKRTGVSVENLALYNGIKEPNKEKIFVGKFLNLSDPNVLGPTTTASVNLGPDIGTIDVNEYSQFSEILLSFNPAQGNNSENYYWFQTFKTNDADINQRYNPDRPLKWVYGNDETAGMSAAYSKCSAPLICHYDFPNRSAANKGTVHWSATTSLIKKTDGGYVMVAIFQYSFKVVNTNEGDIIASPLEFNPKLDKTGADYQWHVQKMDEYFNH